MASLVAGAAAISITAGLGEFLGYALRSVAGYVADKTGKYWLITFIGYIRISWPDTRCEISSSLPPS
jgi:hypothetical protein